MHQEAGGSGGGGWRRMGRGAVLIILGEGERTGMKEVDYTLAPWSPSLLSLQ